MLECYLLLSYVRKVSIWKYVQLVSFGCGHDAYLSDEITRMMKKFPGKTPLILKVDESDNQGPLGIRVRSFLETVKMGHEKHQKLEVKELQRTISSQVYKRKQERKNRIGSKYIACILQNYDSSIKRDKEFGQLLWISGVKKQFVWERNMYIMIFVSQHRSSSEKHWRHWKVESMMTKMLRSLWGNMSETVD